MGDGGIFGYRIDPDIAGLMRINTRYDLKFDVGCSVMCHQDRSACVGGEQLYGPGTEDSIKIREFLGKEIRLMQKILADYQVQTPEELKQALELIVSAN